MKEQEFKMVYLGSPVHHSKLVNVYKECCNAIQMKNDIEVFDVSLEEFYMKTAELKLETNVDICITLPHKVAAFNVCDELTERAKIAGSVNVITNENGKYVGDNTDGVGFIESNKAIHDVQFEGKKILLIGAGGCARGLVQQISKEYPSLFHVSGRQSNKFEKLKADFDSYYDDSFLLEDLPNIKYDVVINATSSSVNKTFLPLPARVLNQATSCLECAYSWNGQTSFAKWCYQNGVEKVYDGTTMLIEQALFAMDFFKGAAVSRDKVHGLLGINKAAVA